ncbi:MAG: hypothetical protein ACREYF_12075 [Gammaproteobacteria bacterium]
MNEFKLYGSVGTASQSMTAAAVFFKAGLVAYGVNPNVANVGVELARKAVLSGGGNDVTQHYYAPAGYALCAAWVGVHSITGGARISFIFDGAGNIAIGAKTPAKNFSEGRQWARSDIKVLWVRNNQLARYQQSGICFSTPVTSPNERYECGDVGRCQEYHLGRAFPITANPGNYIVKE